MSLTPVCTGTGVGTISPVSRSRAVSSSRTVDDAWAAAWAVRRLSGRGACRFHVHGIEHHAMLNIREIGPNGWKAIYCWSARNFLDNEAQRRCNGLCRCPLYPLCTVRYAHCAGYYRRRAESGESDSSWCIFAD